MVGGRRASQNLSTRQGGILEGDSSRTLKSLNLNKKLVRQKGVGGSQRRWMSGDTNGVLEPHPVEVLMKEGVNAEIPVETPEWLKKI